MPKEERVPVPGIETKQSGALRSHDQIQIDNTPYHQPPAPSTRSRNSNRSTYDNGIPLQPRNVVHSISNGGRRVAPIKSLDEVNG